MQPLTESPREGCPKRMVFGPCGGVRDDGRCELAEHPCVFLDQPLARWPDPAAAPPLPDRPAPAVLVDLSVTPYDPDSVRRVVEILAPVVDGLLVGEHANRPDFPPTMFAAEVIGAGGRLWTTLACRDRNRVVLEQELAGLAAVGVEGVLCVTGDGRGLSVRPGVTQVYDLDGIRLTALAASMGLTTAVPESPEAPPVELRPARVAEKQRAGAQLCVLNHVRTAGRVAQFVAAARAAGATLPFVAAVAVYSDETSARRLQRFPGVHLDDAAVEAVLAADDPRQAGIDAAVAQARELLAVPGVAGVNLSGAGSGAGVDEGARVKAEVAAQIQDGGVVL